MRSLLIVAALLALVAAPAALALDVHTHADVQATAPTVPPAPSVPAAPALPLAAPQVPTLALPDALPATPLSQGSDDLGVGGVTILAPASVPAGSHASRASMMAQAMLPAAERAAPPAIAAAGLLALVQALGGFRLAAVGGVALYSRLTRSNLLDNEHREKVYKLIQETPGLGVSEVAKTTGLGWGTTVYHLDRLEREGFVASERGGLHRCYFAVGSVDRETRKNTAALKGDTSASVANLLRERPGITQSELCAALNMSASAASKQISKLETAGLVRREREWKTVRLFPQPALGSASPFAVA